MSFYENDREHWNRQLLSTPLYDDGRRQGYTNVLLLHKGIRSLRDEMGEVTAYAHQYRIITAVIALTGSMVSCSADIIIGIFILILAIV